jgi:NAD(P)-dependent dehydrogenase (short-subunit alcohol dehydrogenase family)
MTSGIAFVTGGGSDIGRAVAMRLARDGHSLVLLDVAADALDESRAAVAADGAECRSFVCDVIDQSAVRDIAAEALHGRAPDLMVLVNSAALVLRRSLLDTTAADWERVFDVNVHGAFVCTQVLAGHMLEAGGGAIVNVASTTGPVTPEPGTSAYGASKAALLALTQSTAIELGRHGIRCNAVSPGFVRTRATEAAYADSEVRNARDAAVPLGRVGRPDDVADAVAFLASDAARFVTGENLVVDGGLTRNLFAQIPGRERI